MYFKLDYLLKWQSVQCAEDGCDVSVYTGVLATVVTGNFEPFAVVQMTVSDTNEK